ncbi:MAG: ABC transporter substrate-binding protein, partial [Spirochaetales bacterium]
DPAWAQIDAVKNGRLRAMPSDFHSWDQPGASWILGLQWLALTWHEERFPNVDMREELVNFYQDFFFQDRSFVEENVLSRLNGLD